MHLGTRLLQLGPPRRLPTADGLQRMPRVARPILPLTGTTDFVELDIRSEAPFAGW